MPSGLSDDRSAHSLSSLLLSLERRFYEHRRRSVVLNLPGLEVFPGDLLVSDGAADYLCHPLLLLNSGLIIQHTYTTCLLWKDIVINQGAWGEAGEGSKYLMSNYHMCTDKFNRSLRHQP